VAIDSDPRGDLENPVKIYLREIARFPSITRVREFELTEIMRSGGEQAAGGALEELVQSNILVVVAIAKRYGRGVKILDLVVAGNNGLVEAMRHFDCHRGYRFSSYAIWWIRQSIIRASRIH
jgi:RNA polymerase primary sigma factor